MTTLKGFAGRLPRLSLRPEPRDGLRRFPRHHYGLGLAACPRCDTTCSVFVRDLDDLVCESCRELGFASRHSGDGGDVALTPTHTPHRHLLRKIP